jgi:nitrite reductase (NADH) small subunit
MNASPSVQERWIDVGASDAVPVQGARRVSTPYGDIAIFKTVDGSLFALQDRCPHKGGPLSQGIVHGRAVACPLHNWSIDLASGQPLGADAGRGCARAYPVRQADGRILLWTEGALHGA